MYNILASFEGNVIAEDGAFVHDVLGLSDDGISFECALVRQSALGICNQGIGTDEAVPSSVRDFAVLALRYT